MSFRKAVLKSKAAELTQVDLLSSEDLFEQLDTGDEVRTRERRERKGGGRDNRKLRKKLYEEAG